MSYLAVKNLQRFQHYKERRPPWIKLYQDLLEDLAFTRLQDASRAHLMCIWLLASRYENSIPNDAKWIEKAIIASGPVDIEVLVSAGFLLVCEDASDVLAKCSENARTEDREQRLETADVVDGAADYALAITVTANQAIADKWGAQPNVLHFGAAQELAAGLSARGVLLDTARASILDQIARRRSADGPPRSIHWFQKGIQQAWEQEEQRRLDATTALSAPRAVRPIGASRLSKQEVGRAALAAWVNHDDGATNGK